MPTFDPNFPANGSALQSAPFRNQFNALHTEITTIPQGPPGPPGPVNLFIDENNPGGSNGDVWLRPSDGEVFRKQGGVWVDKGSLKGPPGDPGPTGGNGDKGDQGDKGDPGEVTQAQLDSSISGTSSNTNGVGTLDTPMADPDSESLRDKLNELILNGRR